MQEYLDLYALGGTMDKDDIVAAIDGGTAALGQAWPGWYVPTNDTSASYTVIPTRLTDDDTPKNTSMYGVWCIGIPNNAPHKDLAMELLEYVMSPEVQLDSIKVGGVPCRTSCLLNEDVLATYPQYETVCAALETGVYRPVHRRVDAVHQHSGHGDGQHHPGHQDHRPGPGRRRRPSWLS